MPNTPYNKIVSLVPSLTELLVDLGLGKQIAGRTRFCVHPADKVKNVEIIGGTKNPNIEKIIDIGADLVIANKEENREEDVKKLRSITEVLVTDIGSVEDAMVAIKKIGETTGRTKPADNIISKISTAISERPNTTPMKTAYFIWKDPWMSVGQDTYIHDVMNKYNLINVFGDQDRYPATDLTKLSRLSPELILLSSEPYPFKEKHIKEIKNHFPHSTVKLVNGEWFSWYGSRMLSSFKALNKWVIEL